MELIWRNDKWHQDPPICIEGTLHWFTAAVLALAVITNIFNWLYQTLRIEKFKTGKRKNQTCYHIFFVIALIFEIFIYLGLSMVAWFFFKDEPILYRVFSGLYALTFIVVGLTFAIVGIKFYVKFKGASPEFAMKKRFQIFASIAIIFISFLIRGSNNLFAAIVGKDFTLRLEWLENPSFWVAIGAGFYYMIVDVVPSVYLSLGIWIITHEYKERKLQASYLSKTNSSGFSYDENSQINDQPDLYEATWESFIPENSIERKTTNWCHDNIEWGQERKSDIIQRSTSIDIDITGETSINT